MKSKFNLIVLFFGLLGIYIVGCIAMYPEKIFKQDDITIICATPFDLKMELRKLNCKDPFAEYCNAYYDADSKTIYVPWSNDLDIKGQPLPDFALLGHEYWHVVDGWWHGGTVFTGKTNIIK